MAGKPGDVPQAQKIEDDGTRGTLWLTPERLRELDNMDALEVGDGIVDVHHSAVNHDPWRLPRPGRYVVVDMSGPMIRMEPV